MWTIDIHMHAMCGVIIILLYVIICIEEPNHAMFALETKAQREEKNSAGISPICWRLEHCESLP